MLNFLTKIWIILLAISLPAKADWVFSVIGGQSNMDVQGGNQFITLDNRVGLSGKNLYIEPFQQPHAATWGVFVGKEKSFCRWGILQGGLGFYQNRSATVQGANYNYGLSYATDYQFKVKQQRLLAEGKWLFPIKKYFNPYVWGAIGGAYNKAYAYKEIPLYSDVGAGTPFNDHTEKNFAYGLGAGLEISLLKNLRLGVGYQYLNTGDVSLSPTDQQNTNEVMTFDRLSGSVVIAQLSFIFDGYNRRKM